MGSLEIAALSFFLATLAVQILTIILSSRRCAGRRVPCPDGGLQPALSIVRPVRGVDFFDELTLASSFTLDYPDYEVIFCCADGNDPAVALVRGLIEKYPGVKARLLIGDNRSTSNPKLNNVLKGWDGARHDLIVLADSNVLMPSDYLQRLLGAWRSDTGLVCSPPVGSMPSGAWAEIECAFLNTYQARWQLAADSIGMGFAQGKSMLWRRRDVDPVGGLRALASEAAEDAAATKVVRRNGLRVRLVDRPFAQPLGPRTAKQVWSRQVRWARLRRATFPLLFLPEILTGSFLPFAAAVYAASGLDLNPAVTLSAAAIVWYGGEALLARAAGWHMTWMSPLAFLARDLMLPAVWIAAWLGNDFNWRGNAMTIAVKQ